MDSDLVYIKTTSGEEAILQRTKVMQRNVRMILILVDGQSTVGDLCGKTGNVQLTENALRVLENGGFVEPRTDHEPMWAERKKSPRAATREATNDQDGDRALIASTKPPVTEPTAPDSRVFVQSVLPVNPRSGTSTVPFVFTPVPSLQGPVADGAATLSSDTPTPPMEQKASANVLFTRWRNAWSARAVRAADAKVSIAPTRRAPQSSLGWPGIMGLSLLILAVVISVAVVFFPYDLYLPQVEAALTRATGRSVTVSTVRVVIYPKPGLVLGDVTISAGTAEIHVNAMYLQPALETLTAPKPMFRQAVISGVVLPLELVSGLSPLFATIARPEAGFGVERVRFEKTNVSFKGLNLSDLEGEARFSADGLFQSLLLHSPDRNLSLQAKPEGERLDVVLEGFGWRPSAKSAFLFDSLNVHGTIDEDVLTISSMNLRIFDGLIQGVAVLQANDKPSMSGSVLFERINANRFGDVLGVGKQFSGETTGKMRFSTTADSWDAIFSALEADGEFTIRRGNVRGIDFAEAIRRASRTPVQGGITLFEKLSGKIRLTATGYQFSGLFMNSGLMESTGQFDVSRDLQVAGKMELQMKGSANHRRVPISISGPLKAPSVLAGAG